MGTAMTPPDPRIDALFNELMASGHNCHSIAEQMFLSAARSLFCCECGKDGPDVLERVQSILEQVADERAVAAEKCSAAVSLNVERRRARGWR